MSSHRLSLQLRVLTASWSTEEQCRLDFPQITLFDWPYATVSTGPVTMANHQARPAQPSPPSAAVVRKYNVKRSCIRCHERKVRCNKDTPCITCVRSDVQCRYPGPERAKRVKSRSQNAVEPSAVAPANTEAQSGGRSTQSNPGPGPRTAPQTRETDDPGHLSTVHCAPSESEQSGGFLLKEGSSTRYVNEFTFSRILDKVRRSLACTWTKVVTANWY